MGTGTRGIQATKNEPTIDSGTALLRAAGMASSGQVKIEIPAQLSRQHIQVSLHAPLGRGLSLEYVVRSLNVVLYILCAVERNKLISSA